MADEPMKPEDEASEYTPEEMDTWVRETYSEAVIERFERMREPFPTGSFRVMTLNVDTEAQLIAAVFLPANARREKTPAVAPDLLRVVLLAAQGANDQERVLAGDARAARHVRHLDEQRRAELAGDPRRRIGEILPALVR